MIQTDGDKFMSGPQYWPKCVLNNYHWLYFERKCVNLK